ncbi:MAG: hypothetical protein PWP57_1266 [Candidatus Atribacteria bacterium]|nr:hypothetical protein [Candidatus Atribacteria bacterium]
MKSARKYLLLGLAVVLFAALLSGCSVTVGPRPPVYGSIKLCAREGSVISGWVYIDGNDMGKYVDGWSRPYCTDWIRMTLDEEHLLEIRGSRTWRGWFTPTRDGQTFTLDTYDGETLIIY